jgi:hypothetical protein
LRWIESASVPLIALDDEDIVERALIAIGLRLDGKAAAATMARRKRAVFYNVLDVAATATAGSGQESSRCRALEASRGRRQGGQAPRRQSASGPRAADRAELHRGP